MAISKISIDKFLELRKQHPVFDVRSPGEYGHAHIPGALNLPLFSDEERKVVGTAYKQQSREVAVKIGLDYFGAKMRRMVEEVEEYLRDRNERAVLVHCWRGGMRSAGVAWLLDLYGFKVYTLTGGYKAYRKWVRDRFEEDYPFHIIGGYTGSGKTGILHQLQNDGYTVIDLEALAKHRGSAFGAVDGEPQPTQEMFENLLAEKLSNAKGSPLQGDLGVTPGMNAIWLEDESQRIGRVNLPQPLWDTMRRSRTFFLEVPFEERLKHIVEEYGVQPKEKLAAAVQRIQKRLGGLETKTTLQFLDEGNITEAFRILLKYYDKQYDKALGQRTYFDIHAVLCDAVDSADNVKRIMTCKQQAENFY